MRKFGGLPTPVWLLAVLPFLTACDGKKDEFVNDCMAGGGTKASCECYYEFGEDGLNSDHMLLFAAVVSGNNAKISKAQSDLGMIGTGVAMARIGWVVANAESSCSGL